MKWIRKCPLFYGLVISGMLFTSLGIIGKNSIYKDYEYQWGKTPFAALVMEGISKGEYPLEHMNFSTSSVIEAVSGALNLPMGNKDGEGSPDKAVDGTTGSPLEVEAIPNESGKEILVQGEHTQEDRIREFQVVGEDYFDDAAFIGDSRTVGLFEYGGLGERSDFFAKTSLTIYDVLTKEVMKDEETGEKITIEDALQKKQYGKVYLMLGINELGTGTTQTFMKEYEKVVERIRQLQPEAVIFVEGIMRVAQEKDATDPIFNNTNINERNNAIAQLADNRQIFYIDVNEVVCDKNGNLEKDYTTDEIHLKAQYYEIWKQFLMNKGIE